MGTVPQRRHHTVPRGSGASGPRRSRCWLCETSGRVLLHLRLRVDGWKGVCRRCVAKRRWVTVREALQGGFPIATLRLAASTTKLDAKTRLLTPLFSLDELESLACTDPTRADRLRAKLDLRALVSDARRARAVLSVLRDALERAGVLEMASEGPLLALLRQVRDCVP